MNLPKSVTSPRLRAKIHTGQSVQGIITKMAAAMRLFGVFYQIRQMEPLRPEGSRARQRTPGTKHMRMSVTMFAGVHNFTATWGAASTCSFQHGLFAFHFVQQRIGYGDSNDIARFAARVVDIGYAIDLGSLAHCATEQLAVLFPALDEHVHDSFRHVGYKRGVKTVVRKVTQPLRTDATPSRRRRPGRPDRMLGFPLRASTRTRRM